MKKLTKTEEEIRATVRKWSTSLGLDNYDSTIHFIPGKLKKPHRKATATMETNHRYEWAVLSVSVRKYKKCNAMRREELLVHEMVHILLEPLESRKGVEVERAATRMARSLLGRYDRG